jgi:hypothetical protein
MRLLIILATLLALAACDKSIAPERAAAIRSVGVIAAVGDVFYHQKIGWTVFGNDESTSPIESWGLDEHVIRTVTGALRQRYDVRALSYPRGAFAPDRIYFPNEGSIFGESRRPLGEVVRSEVQPQGLDAYVVITKGHSGFASTNQSVRGIGVVQSSGLMRAGTFMHVLYWVTVLDGRDFKVIGDVRAPSLSARPALDYLVSGSPPMIRGPFQATEQRYVVSRLEGMSPELLARLQEDVRRLLDRSLPGALRDVKLLDERDLASVSVGGGGD